MERKENDKKCLRCGHEWCSYLIKPKVCPECGSYRWNVPPLGRGRPRQHPRADGLPNIYKDPNAAIIINEKEEDNKNNNTIEEKKKIKLELE